MGCRCRETCYGDSTWIAHGYACLKRNVFRLRLKVVVSVVSRMVESVNTGHESTRNVIRDAIQGSSEGTLAALHSRRTLSRRIQRARGKLNPTPPIPAQQSGFEIPDKYTKQYQVFAFCSMTVA